MILNLDCSLHPSVSENIHDLTQKKKNIKVGQVLKHNKWHNYKMIVRELHVYCNFRVKLNLKHHTDKTLRQLQF